MQIYKIIRDFCAKLKVINLKTWDTADHFCTIAKQLRKIVY